MSPAKRDASSKGAPLSRQQRKDLGKAARTAAPLESHATLDVDAGRPDPVALLVQQAKSRVPELVPIRYGRMLVSPFTFFRGAALPMAADLSKTPTSGLRAQLCGDAHLSNFGAFASPERRLDLRHQRLRRIRYPARLSGTSSGSWPASLSRVATVATPLKARRKIALAAGREYRIAMRSFAESQMLDVWYAHVDVEAFLAEIKRELDPRKSSAPRRQWPRRARRTA